MIWKCRWTFFANLILLTILIYWLWRSSDWSRLSGLSASVLKCFWYEEKSSLVHNIFPVKCDQNLRTYVRHCSWTARKGKLEEKQEVKRMERKKRGEEGSERESHQLQYMLLPSPNVPSLCLEPNLLHVHAIVKNKLFLEKTAWNDISWAK